MKSALAAAVLAIAMVSAVHAATIPSWVADMITKPASSPQMTIWQEARSGCCSWHGGVCGCSAGRALCCDGQLSPSCGC